MESYGPYETSREISSAAGTVVFSAHKPGGAEADDYVVKVYALEPLIGDDRETKSELKPLLQDLGGSFISRIELQQKASQTSPHIAPVFEFSRDERGVWYATRNYPRSLQKIIAGRVTLGKEVLFHVVRCILRGTLDLKKTSGRSHGNLKPSNVLLSGGAKIKEAEVALSDPLPGDESEAARYERADLRAMGELIYQLVRRRELSDATDWLILPIESSREWTELFGKEAKDWLVLCNRLLDPNLSLETYDLERLDRDLAALQPKPPVSKKALLAAAVALLIAGAGLMVFVQMHKYGTLLIASDPPGADIFVNDLAKGQTSSDKALLKLRLRKGSYEVVARTKYSLGETLAKTNPPVELSGGKTETIRFVFEHGSVRIESVPKAMVSIGGKEVPTPYTIPMVRPGLVRFQLNQEQHASTEVEGIVTNGEQLRLVGHLIPKQPGEELVEFESNLPASEKFVLNDGKYLINASVPPSRKLLPVGTHTITATFRTNWPSVIRKVNVEPVRGAKARFDFDYAVLKLDSDPPGATVLVNNQLAGVTPTNNLWLPAKGVKFEFKVPGYESATIVTDMVNEVVLSLSPRLVPIVGFVEVRSETVPAEIFLDQNDRSLGQIVPGAPFKTKVPPGPHVLIGRYESALVTNRFEVKPGATEPVRLSFDYGKVRLESNLQGAQFFDANERPLKLENSMAILPARTHTLIAKHPGYDLPGVTNSVLINKEQQTAQMFEFRYGTVSITSVPPVVEVKENGKPIASTPVVNRLVMVGPVTYELIWKENKSTSIRAIIENGRRYSFGDDLTKFRQTYTNIYEMEFVSVGDYYVGRFEVSQEQYRKVMGSNTVEDARPNQPVTLVSWNSALTFCQLLSQKDKDSLKNNSLAGFAYGLPGEADWASFADLELGGFEEAVFTGSVFGNPEAPLEINPQRKSFNRLGLYDLYGNVMEWCIATNGQGITMGGAYNARNTPNNRATRFRNPNNAPIVGAKSIGFRCLLKNAPAAR